jgi:hypothetical protein
VLDCIIDAVNTEVNREFSLIDETEEAITENWNGPTLHNAQSVFLNWMSRLVRVIENGG